MAAGMIGSRASLCSGVAGVVTVAVAENDWHDWPEEKKRLLRARLLERRAKPWRETARPEQLPPEGDWYIWFLVGGRGAGKTRSGAEWLGEELRGDGQGDESAILAPTFGDARDRCVEGPSGLLRALGTSRAEVEAGRSWTVERWNRSMGELRLRSGAVVNIDGADDGALRIQGGNLRRAWCVEAGQRVATRRGPVPIAEVRVGDEVMTRASWRPVTAHALMRRAAPLVRVATEEASVLVTADHPVWTHERGWTPANALRVGDTLRLWKSSPALPHGSNGTASAGIATAPATTRTAPECSCIPSSGSVLTGSGSRQTSSSITATVTARTTGPRTLSSCRCASTWPSTAYSGGPTHPRSSGQSALLSASPGRSGSRASGLAHTAAAPSDRRGSGLSSAPLRVGTPTPVSSIELAGHGDVYDLTVDGEHEFFAEGLLVKNCDELRLWKQAEQAWDESLLPAVRIGRPHIVVTSTPKPVPLVRRLLKDPGVIKSRMTTFENEANLAPAFLEQMRGRYGGTRLGQQELEGALIEDVEGALFKRAWIDAHRATREPYAGYRAKTVALDPSDGTAKGDAQGLVLAGLGMDNDFYVLGAEEHRDASQLAWIKRALELCQAHGAKLVWERNHGGGPLKALIEMVMGQTGIRAPMREVFASTGKRVRAEPVAALYEGGAVRTQGRVRHLGEFTQLEEEMTSWVPGEPSPNLMDALTWAMVDLMGYGAPPGFGGEGSGVASYDNPGAGVVRWG